MTVSLLKNLSYPDQLATKLIENTDIRNPCFIYGETGKATFLKSIFPDTVFCDTREILEIKNLAGFYAIRDGELIYTEGILVDAMKKGLKLCFKKIDTNPNVLHFLRPVINSRRIVAACGDEVVADPNFRIFFTSKEVMNVRNVDFIGPIEFTFDSVLESFGSMKEMVARMLLLLRESKNDKCSIEKGIDCEGLCSKEQFTCDCHAQSHLCSRHFRLLIELKSSIFKIVGESCELTSLDRANVCQIFTNLFLKHDCKQLLEEFYTKNEPLCLPNMALAKTAAVESAMRALILNIKLRKPTLLVGETGAGKTAIIQYLCNHSHYFFGSHTSLKVINMSSDFDGTDLIGGYCSIDFDKRISELYHKIRLEIPKSLSRKKMLENLIDKTDGETRAEAKNLLFSIDKKVPFFYKEGVLTRAMKEGSWILLDEVNLSSDETLNLIEAILSKDEVILYESGNFTPLKVHPNFTIFACMNPFGDYGKKRYETDVFNKISFFDFSYRLKCIKSVVQAVTKNQLEDVDKISEFYFEFKSNIARKAFSNVIEPLISGRTLCRALKIILQLRDDKTKILKAFNLLFFTQLDLTSRCQALNLFKKHFQYSTFANDFENLQNIDNFILTPKVKMHLADVDLAIKADIPVLLQGDTSTGKTSLIYALASRYGRKIVRINNHNQTESSDYIGNYTTSKNGIVFNHGPLVLAMLKGNWVILDELNLAPSDVLEVLNRLLDDNKEIYIPETDEIIKPHPNFKLFATQNLNYGGRNGLAKSFRNRFVEIFFYEKDESEIKEILEKACKMPQSFIKYMMGVYSALKTERSLNSLITLRDLFKWARRMPGSYYEVFEIGLDILLERQRSAEDKEKIIEVFKTVFAERFGYEKKDFSSIYFSNSYCFLAKESIDSNNADYYFSNIAKDLVLTKSYIKLINLIYKAWSNQEPVLLIGETGIGKTKICEIVSSLFKIGLKSINVHNGTESSDFIGHSFLDRSEIVWKNGPLVEAMLQGDAFLIDEINLAEDSALERLNSVLEDGRSLFIPEIKKDIKAAGSFQVIATMNPSGDFGKRELSPALRSRFTEIYFSLDQDEYRLIFNSLIDKVNLKPIVAQGLKSRFLSLGDMSIRKVETICKHISNIISDNPNKTQSDAFSIVFSDIRELDSIWNEVLELVGTRSSSCYELQFTEKELSIRPYSLVSSTNLVQQNFNFNTATSRLNLQRIIRGLTLDKGILLQGEPGVGKTSLIQSLARSLRIPVLRINLSEQTEMSDLVGTYLPIGDSIKFVESELIEYIRKGYWVVLDEINLCTQSVIEGLNSILDYRKKIDVDGKTVKVHCNTRIFGTMNPFNSINGRKNLPKSFLDRFMIIQMDNYTEPDIKSILAYSFGDNYLFNKDFSLRGNIKLNEVYNLRDYSFDGMRVTKENCNLDGSLKQPIALDDLVETLDQDLTLNNKDNLKQNLKSDGHAVQYKFDGDLKLARFGSIEFDIKHLPTDYVIPHCQLSQLEILFRCMLKRIPVIISGSTGKNSLLRFVSNLLDLKLCVLECHKDTDVSDILGQFQKNEFTSDSSALFSWKNSIVINALQERSLVVFSTPELVDKTVFDRLNSLFESERFINIYEKGYDTSVSVNECARFVLLCDNPYLLSPALLDRCVTVDLSSSFDYLDLYKMFTKAPALNIEKTKKFRSSLKDNLFIDFADLPVSIEYGSLDIDFKRHEVFKTLPTYLNKKIDIYNTIDESVIDSIFKIEPVPFLEFDQAVLDVYKEISSYSSSLPKDFSQRISNLVSKPYFSTLIKSYEFDEPGSLCHINCKNVPGSWLGYKEFFIENLKTKNLGQIQDILTFVQRFAEVKDVTRGYFDESKFAIVSGSQDPLNLVRTEILNEKIKKENEIKLKISDTAKNIYKYGKGDIKPLIDLYNSVSLSFVSQINDINRRLKRNYQKYKELMKTLTLCEYLNNAEVRDFLEDFSDINDYYLECLFNNRSSCSKCVCFSTEEIHSSKQCSLRMIKNAYKPEKLLKPEFSKYFFNKIAGNPQNCNSLVVESLAFNDLHQGLLTDALMSEYNQEILCFSEDEIDSAIRELFPTKTRACVIDTRSTCISVGMDIIPSLNFDLQKSDVEKITREKDFNKKILQSVASMSIFSTPEQIINELQLIREQNEAVVTLPLSDEYAVFVQTVKKLDLLEAFFKNLYKLPSCLALVPNYSYFLYLYFTDLTVPTLENYFMNCTVYEFIDRLSMAQSFLKIHFSEVLYNCTLLFKSFELEKLTQSKYNETRIKLLKEPKLYEQTISQYVDRFLYLPVLGILKVNFDMPICPHKSIKDKKDICSSENASICLSNPHLYSLLESVPLNTCACECEKWIYLSKNIDRDLICNVLNTADSLEHISSLFYNRKVSDLFSYPELCLAKLFNNIVANSNSSKYDERTFKALLSCLHHALNTKDVFFIYFAYKFSEFFEESDQLEDGVGLKSGQGQNNIEDKIDEDDICDDIDQNENQNRDSEGIDMDNEGDLQSVSAQDDENELESGVDDENIEQGNDESQDSDERGEVGDESEPDINQADAQEDENEDDLEDLLEVEESADNEEDEDKSNNEASESHSDSQCNSESSCDDDKEDSEVIQNEENLKYAYEFREAAVNKNQTCSSADGYDKKVEGGELQEKDVLKEGDGEEYIDGEGEIGKEGIEICKSVTFNKMSGDCTKLTNLLRIILESNKNNKYKGDFKSGKKLNLKKIVPYIASDYRKDKIWMKRTKSDKKDYKVRIFIDNSKSMFDQALVNTLSAIFYKLESSFSLLNIPITLYKFGHSVQECKVEDLSFNEDRTTLDWTDEFTDGINVILTDGVFQVVGSAKDNFLVVMIDKGNIKKMSKVNVIGNKVFVEKYLDSFALKYCVVKQVEDLEKVFIEALSGIFKNYLN